MKEQALEEKNEINEKKNECLNVSSFSITFSREQSRKIKTKKTDVSVAYVEAIIARYYQYDKFYICSLLILFIKLIFFNFIFGK